MAKKDIPFTLSDFSHELDKQSARKELEKKEFNRLLGEPVVFIADKEDARFGVGFWKAKGGVVAYRRYANGYDNFSRMEYSDELITLLNKVRE